MKDYAKVTNPLRKMQNDAQRWRKAPEFSEEEKAAFNKVKGILLSDAVLNHPDWNEKFEVHTDASQDGLGAVLPLASLGPAVCRRYSPCARGKSFLA